MVDSEMSVSFVTSMSVLSCVLNTPASVFAALSNALCLHTLYRFPVLRSKHYMLTASLSFAAFLTGVFFQPVHVVHSMQPVVGLFSCAVHQTYLETTKVATLVALWTVLFLGIERYLKVTCPFQYQIYVSRHRLLAAIIFSWLCPLLVIKWPWERNERIRVITGGLLTLLPLAIVIILYFVMLRILRLAGAVHPEIQRESPEQPRARRESPEQPRARRECPEQSTKRRESPEQPTARRESPEQSTAQGISDTAQPTAPTQNEEATKAKRRNRLLFKTTVYLVGCLVICLFYFPLGLSLVYVAVVKPSRRTRYILKALTNTVMFLNSILNPCIYFWQDSRLRKRALQILTCQ